MAQQHLIQWTLSSMRLIGHGSSVVLLASTVHGLSSVMQHVKRFCSRSRFFHPLQTAPLWPRAGGWAKPGEKIEAGTKACVAGLLIELPQALPESKPGSGEGTLTLGVLPNTPPQPLWNASPSFPTALATGCTIW